MNKINEKPWSRKPLLIFPVLILSFAIYWFFMNRANFKDSLTSIEKGMAKAGWQKKCFLEDVFLMGNTFNSSTSKTDFLLTKWDYSEQGTSSIFKVNLQNCQIEPLGAKLPQGGILNNQFVFSRDHALRETLTYLNRPTEIIQLHPPESLELAHGENPDLSIVSNDGFEIAWRKKYSARYAIQTVSGKSVEIVDMSAWLSKPREHALIAFDKNELIVIEEGSIQSFNRRGEKLWGPVSIANIHPMWRGGNIKLIGTTRPPQIISWTNYALAPIISMADGKVTKISLDNGYQVASTSVSQDGKLIAIVAEPARPRDTLFLIYDLQTGQNLYKEILGAYARPIISFWSPRVLAASLTGRSALNGTVVFEK